MTKGNIFISNVCAAFENLLHAHSEKKASCLEYFGQKFPINGKIARKSARCRTIMTDKRQKICLLFTETNSIKQYRERLLAIIYCEWKNE